MPKANDLTGQTFGHLTARERCEPPTNKGNRSMWWRCECACGRGVSVRADRLRTHDKTYCHASRHPDLAPPRIDHTLPRHSHPLTYQYWEGIMAQKTIAVCERWTRFEMFLADMGERPSKAHVIRRRDKPAGYHPSNCTWHQRTFRETV